MSAGAARMEVNVCADADAVAVRAADLILEAGNEDLVAHGGFDVCLAGGSTPRAIHAQLVARRRALDWARPRFFFGDERAVGPEHADSNYRMARETLFDPLGVPAAHVHRMEGEAASLSAAAADYATTLREHVFAKRADGVPAFDLMLLGLGADAHTASLFPRTEALWERERLVVPNTVPGQAHARLTVTLPVVNAARRVLCVVVGATKAAALARVLEGEHDVSLWPAQGIAPHPGQLTWLVDAAAASALSGAGVRR